MPQTTPSPAYDEGHSIGTFMKEQRAAGDFSYDVRWDLADAAKQGKEYFAEFKRGLEAGLDT